MAPRVWRIITPATPVPSTMDGSRMVVQVAAEILPGRHVAGGRQPAQAHREQQDEHDAEPEVGHRETGERDSVGGGVDGRAPARRPRARRPGCRSASAMSMEPTASSTVTGSLEASSSVTGILLRSDSPRSPRSSLPIQIAYCTGDRPVEMVLRPDAPPPRPDRAPRRRAPARRRRAGASAARRSAPTRRTASAPARPPAARYRARAASITSSASALAGG